jgi:hypothetical protein
MTKIDIRALKRALSTVEREIERWEKLRSKAMAKIAKWPRPRQAKNREGMVELASSDRRLAPLVDQRSKIAALIDEVAACADSCSTECQTARTDARVVQAKAPAPKKAVKRARAPSREEQQLIAQAHLFELMRRNSPRVRLPDVPIPATDWQPDGPRQVAAYRRIFDDVFDGVFWEAADVAMSDLGADSDRAEAIARASSPQLWDEFRKSGGNVVSMDNRLRKGQLRRPSDAIFFPDGPARTQNPRRKRVSKAAGRQSDRRRR